MAGAESRSLLEREDDADEPRQNGRSSSSACPLWLGSALVLLLVVTPAVIVYGPSYYAQSAQEAPVVPQGSSGTSALSSPRHRKLSQSEALARISNYKRQHGGRQQRRQRKKQQKWEQQQGEDELNRHDAKPASLVHTHVIPQGGALAIECAAGTYIRSVRFASFGTPVTNVSSASGERLLAADPKCHSRRSEQVVADACVGQSHCCLPVGTDNFRDDPCRGVVKTLAVTLEGCDEVKPYTRFKRHCSLMGQPLLCDEDIEFLTTLDLPVASEPILPHVAMMVDTSYRPHLQVIRTHAALSLLSLSLSATFSDRLAHTLTFTPLAHPGESPCSTLSCTTCATTPVGTCSSSMGRATARS